MHHYPHFQDIQGDVQNQHIIYHSEDPIAYPAQHHTYDTHKEHNYIAHPEYKKISEGLTMQPYLSDQYFMAHPQQFNYQKHNIRPDELNLHLIKEEEQLVHYALRAQSEELNPHYVIPPVQFEDHQAKTHTQDQTHQFADLPIHYHYPTPHIQFDKLPHHHLQSEQTHTPLTHYSDNVLIMPTIHLDQAHFDPNVIYQTQQYHFPSPKVEEFVEIKTEFIKKGPRGEALYKVTEGKISYYVKRGLTPEAVYNYSLAHIIGVGPPVEIIESDGIKMEEGVCLRQAIREKQLTVDEAFKHIQVLHKTLFDTGMAHCDVKFENCLYFPKYGKVLLIDNGDLSAYGNQRKIKTEGMNSTILISPYGHDEKNRVGPATDLQGFLHIMFNTVHTPHDEAVDV